MGVFLALAVLPPRHRRGMAMPIRNAPALREKDPTTPRFTSTSAMS